MAERKRIQSFKELHRLAPQIIKEVMSDHALARRALANPILAMEELGYELTGGAVSDVERHLRYSRSNQKALDDLEAEIKKLVGRAVDMSSETEIEKVLFKQLKLKRLGVRLIIPIDVRSEAERRVAGPKEVEKDPIEPLKDDHPVVRLMMEHRRISNSVPPFASREQYEELKSGTSKLPVSGVRLVFNRDIADHEEGGDNG